MFRTFTEKSKTMENKKSPKADLEKFRSIFMLAGLFITLVLVLTSINVSKADVKINDMNGAADYVDDEMVMITKTPPKPQTPPPPPKQINQTIFEVSNKVDLTDPGFEWTDPGEDTIIFIDDDPFGENITTTEDVPLIFADVMPEFIGGEAALISYIAKNVKYPQMAIENDVQGTVYVRFVVTKTGKVDKVEVSKEVDPILDEEAVRVVKSLPDFKPGMQGGRPVSVYFSVPIIFKLR